MPGYCVRHPELATTLLILCEPTHGSANRGRRHLTYVDMLGIDIGLTDKQEIRTCMVDRDWRKLCYTDTRDEDWQDRPQN